MTLLKNQIFDRIKSIIEDREWEPTTEFVRLIYESTPEGSILRKVCVCAILSKIRKHDYARVFPVFGSSNEMEWKSKWAELNATCPESARDLMWVLFQEGENNLTSGGACQFHDHSDVQGYYRHIVSTCPYSKVVVSASEKKTENRSYGANTATYNPFLPGVKRQRKS